MTRMTLKVFALAMAIVAFVGCGKSGFTDNRDGKIYATTTIGKQIWMAENLNYAMDGSWCYDDDPANCEKYGRLYTWDVAIKACPEGWHLPTNEEWDELKNAIGEELGTKLKSKEWNGTDAFGFNILPVGVRYRGRFQDGGIGGVGPAANFWTATEHNTITRAFFIHLEERAELYSSSFTSDKYITAYSVRCVKD